MISFNLRSSLAIAIICFVLGCCTAFLLVGGCNNDTKQESIAMPEMLKQQADSIKANYQAKITELETRNSHLQQELSTTKAQLKAAKTKTKSKAATIKKIIEPKGYPAKELLKKADSFSVVENSSLLPCDSLVEEVTQYMKLNETEDSLYEAQIAAQDSIIEVKDAVIAFKDSAHAALDKVFNQSLQEQDKLLSENRQLRKRLKRQKLKGKLLAFGSAVLSGLVTHYLIQ